MRRGPVSTRRRNGVPRCRRATWGRSRRECPAVHASLAHELAHAERFQLGYRRPTDLPDVLLDEAETSLRASFTSILSPKDREDLVEVARDRLIQWLALRQQEGETDAQS